MHIFILILGGSCWLLGDASACSGDTRPTDELPDKCFCSSLLQCFWKTGNTFPKQAAWKNGQLSSQHCQTLLLLPAPTRTEGSHDPQQAAIPSRPPLGGTPARRAHLHFPRALASQPLRHRRRKTDSNSPYRAPPPPHTYPIPTVLPHQPPRCSGLPPACPAPHIGPPPPSVPYTAALVGLLPPAFTCEGLRQAGRQACMWAEVSRRHKPLHCSLIKHKS